MLRSFAALPALLFVVSCGVKRVPNPGRFVHPAPGGVNVDIGRPLKWNPDPESHSYRVTVADAATPDRPIFEANDLGLPSVDAPTLPYGYPLTAVLEGVDDDGTLRELDRVSFVAALRFVYPADGALDVRAGEPFRWNRAIGNGPYAYKLTVGTQPDTADVFDSGALTDVEQAIVPTLPDGVPLYARLIVTFPDGRRMRADSVFQTANSSLPEMSLSIGELFRWTDTPLAKAYRLEIKGDGAKVFDSGTVRVSTLAVPKLDAGPHYDARLSRWVGGEWESKIVSFDGAAGGASRSAELSEAFASAVEVNEMAHASLPHVPRTWTPLYRELSGETYAANCRHYAQTLVDLLKAKRLWVDAEGPMRPRTVQVGFVLNGFDGHTLTQVRDARSGHPVLIDPTFEMTFQRRDGSWATLADISRSVAHRAWDDIRYVPLSDRATALAKNYYVDLPLLFLNVDPLDQRDGGRDPRPYMKKMPPGPVQGDGIYLFEGSKNKPVVVEIDGRRQSIEPQGRWHLSRSYRGTTVKFPDSQHRPKAVYRLRRFIFK